VILTNFSAEAITEAIEQGLAEAVTAYVQQAGGTVHDEPEYTWVSTGSPLTFFNGVIRTRLSVDRSDRVIASLLTGFRGCRQLMGWWVMPHTRPSDMPERLEAHGFIHFDRDTGMAIDLITLPEVIPLPVGVMIERVETSGALQEWLRAFGLGFRVSEDRLADYSAMPLGIPPAESAFRYYLARAGEEPVATAMLYPARQVAVIEEVSTVPAMRGRGIGTAVTLAALRKAQALGYRIAVLVASEAGGRIYRRLGFKPYGDRHIYMWRPESK
jgi:GNAT superfamily N-acetyltransferase